LILNHYLTLSEEPGIPGSGIPGIVIGRPGILDIPGIPGNLGGPGLEMLGGITGNPMLGVGCGALSAAFTLLIRFMGWLTRLN